MSEIVWAVNPKKDRVFDLAYRMRRFASDSFTARNIQFRFDGSDPIARSALARKCAARPSSFLRKRSTTRCATPDAKGPRVALEIDRHMMILKVSDDGSGFDQGLADHGQGLASMRRRAEKLGGQLLVISSAGAGASVILKVPLDRRN